jgi:hypothetical protein
MSERVLTVGGNQASRPITDFAPFNQFGNNWFVNNQSGLSTSGNGKSWKYPFLTITEAAAAASAGDNIYIWGDGSTTATHPYVETVTPTVSNLKFISAVPNGVIWTGVTDSLVVSAVVDTYVYGIRFRPSSGYSGISLVGASNATIIDTCRFQGQTGSKYGIVSDGRQSGVKVLGNHFLYMNAATCYGIYGPIYGTTAENASWEIIGNMFHSNTYHLKGNFRYSIIKQNTFSAYGLLSTGAQGAPTKCIDFTTASGAVGNNTVTQNTLGGAYSTTLYVSSNANEDWVGNFAQIDVTTCPNGLTVGVPD